MTQLRFVGVGGQGVILAGEILSAAKIAEGGYGIKASTYTSQVSLQTYVVPLEISTEDKLLDSPYLHCIFDIRILSYSFDTLPRGVINVCSSI